MLLLLPEEKTQGLVQKIFYFHVPSAFCMYAFLVLGAIFSGMYLYDKRPFYDHIAKAGMYTATVFGCLVIGSGPIWAKPIWGVYWTWDPRLTTSFIVFVLLIAYVFARRLLDDRERATRKSALVGAILSILAVLDIPLIHFSAKLMRGLHPSVLGEKDGLTPEFQRGLEMMILSCFFLGALICICLFRFFRIQQRLQDLVQQRFSSEGAQS